MKLFIALLLAVCCLSISVNSHSQSCIKSITFTRANVLGSCLVSNETGSEDIAITAFCNNTLSTQLFAFEWPVAVSSTGFYTLPAPYGYCGNSSNTIVIGSLPSGTTSLPIFIQTFENDDNDCFNTMQAGDDCQNQGNVNLDLTPGTHFLSVGAGAALAFEYTVTEQSIITSIETESLVCSSETTYSATLRVSYNTPIYPCNISSGFGSLGSLSINGQTFPLTGSPQMVTLTNLPSDGNNVSISASFTGDPAGCTRNYSNLFTAPSSTTCAFVSPSGQGCKKRITFTHLYASTCVVGADNAEDGPEDPALTIYCDNSFSSPIYRSEWQINIPTSGFYNLPAPWFDCANSNSFLIGAVANPGTTDIPVYVQTFEGDDNTCSDPADAADDCITQGNSVLHLAAGKYRLDIGGSLVYYYTVENIPLVLDINHMLNTCQVTGEYDVQLEVDFDITPFNLCSLPVGPFTQLIVNNQTFPISTSPQTITLTNQISSNLNAPIAITTAIGPNNTSCIFVENNVFIEPSCFNVLGDFSIDFYLNEQKDHNNLFWETSFNENIAYFELQRSQDITNWTTLSSHFNMANQNNYTFQDYSPLNGTSYYQLIVHFINGTSEIVDIKPSTREISGTFIFPNPCTNYLQLSSNKTISEVKIYSNDGKLLESFEFFENTQNNQIISTENLSNGMYLVLVNNEFLRFEKH